MAEAVGIAAAAVQFLTFATSCLSVFQEFKLNTPESHRILGFRLEAEAAKFREWCAILGVQDILAAASRNPNGWQDSPEISEFQDRLRRLLRFDNERVATLTIHALQDMETTFRKARLKLGVPLDDQATEAKDSPPSAARRSFKGLFRNRKTASASSLSQPMSPPRTTSSTTLSLPSKGSGLFAGVKWVTLEQKTFKSLLSDIININESLNTLLAEDAKTQVRRRYRADILSSPGLEFGDVTDLLPGDPEGQTLAVLAKEVQAVAEDEDASLSESPPSAEDTLLEIPPAVAVKPMSPILDADDFDKGSPEFGPSRSICFLAGRPVLVEWTQYGKSSNLDHFYRRVSLVRLLNDAGVYRKFRTLPSRSVARDTRNSRIGLVFEVPSGLGVAIEEKSLLDLLKLEPLPLGHRFAMAKALSVALYSLQSVNWLHKSIRSDNLVYFEAADKSSEPSKLDVSVKPRSGSDGSKYTTQEVPELYLMGWYLSRPDHPTELSQSLSISTQGYKLTKEMIKLASHPKSLQTDRSSPRPRFRPEYDIYSFGLVLLEIGLWRPLSSLRKRCASDDEFRVKVQGEFCDMLLSTMGAIYWQATKRCLNNEFDRAPRNHLGFGNGNGAEDMPLPSAFERQVVSELERCIA